MESVYLETTFVSYLVARPSRDLVIAAHQQTTQEWWAHRRSAFENCVSQVVIDEASTGDPAEAHKRLAIISGLRTLDLTQDAEALTEAIVVAGVLPPHVVRDAAHIALAAVHSIDYLLTWNCKHLANARIARRIALVCENLGHRMPIICMPEELMGSNRIWEDPIVAEVRRVREELAAKFNYDVDAIFADLMKRQEALGDRLIRLKKKAEPATDVDAGKFGDSGNVPFEVAPPT